MQELIDEAKKRQEQFEAGANERQLSFGAGQVVTAAHQCLKAITDDMIKLFPVNTRLAVARSLQEQVDRWRSGGEA